METGWRAPPPSKAKRVKDCIICYFSIHWLKCGVDPISTAIVEVWKWFKGMKQHSLLSCLHSAHRLQFIVRNCGTRFKCNMVSLQSLIFVVYTYYLTLQFVDKNNLANFQYFPKVPVCKFSSWHRFSLSLQYLLCSDFLPFELSSHGTPPNPYCCDQTYGYFQSCHFSPLLCQSQLWGRVVSGTRCHTWLTTGLWSIFLKASPNSSNWSSQQLKLAWHKGQGPRMDYWLRIRNTRPQNIPEKELYSQLHIQGCRDEWGKDHSENGKKSV